MKTNNEDPVEKLKTLRKKVDTIKETKIKLSTELDSHKKRLEEITKECKKEFDVEIKDLPKTIQKMEKEVEEAIKEVEKLLSTNPETTKEEEPI